VIDDHMSTHAKCVQEVLHVLYFVMLLCI
jgi:hypothetical protein